MVDRERLPIDLLRLLELVLVMQGQPEMVPSLGVLRQQARGRLQLDNSLRILPLLDQLFARQQSARSRIRATHEYDGPEGGANGSENDRRFSNDRHSCSW